MAKVWRIKGKADNKNNAKYFLEKGVLALGWSLADDHLNEHHDGETIREARRHIDSLDSYKNLVETHQIYDGRVNHNIKRMISGTAEGDLVWLNHEGVYYLGQIQEESAYQYSRDPIALEQDLANQLTGVIWYKIGDISYVPGRLVQAFASGQVFQRVHDENIILFSKLIYNKKAGRKYYDDLVVDPKSQSLFSLLSSSDIEDLVALWLYRWEGYMMLPSLCKDSTSYYDYMMIDPKNGKKVFVKIGYDDSAMNALDYTQLDGKVRLFSTQGSVENTKEAKGVKAITTSDLEKFVMSKDPLLPKPITLVAKFYNKLKK